MLFFKSDESPPPNPNKPLEKSSFKRFFTHNFQSLQAFHRSFSRPSPRLPRTIPYSTSIRSQAHLSLTGKGWKAPHLTSFLQRTEYMLPSEPLTGDLEPFCDENLTDNAFSDRFSGYNHLVTGLGPSKQATERFYDRFIVSETQTIGNKAQKGKGIDSKAENIRQKGTETERLSSAKQNRIDLAVTKAEIQELHSQKEDFMRRNKTFRVIKGGFKSGILSVDNPENPNTLLYKPEFTQNDLKNTRKVTFSVQHRARLEQKTQTSEEIAFFNRNYHPDPPKSPSKDPKWTRKHRPTTNNSKNNPILFNDFVTEAEKKKGSWLRSCEVRDFDIISYKTNKPVANYP